MEGEGIDLGVWEVADNLKGMCGSRRLLHLGKRG